MNGNEAAAQAYSGDVEQALSLLRLLYGDKYTFGYDTALGVFWMIRDGKIGSLLTAPARRRSAG